MKTHNSTTKQYLFILIATLALHGCGGDKEGSAAPAKELFSEVGGEVSVPSLSAQDNEPPSVRRRFVRVDFARLKQAMELASKGERAALRLNLFDDRSVEVILDEARVNSVENIVATGRIIGDEDSDVTLVMNNGVLVANVRRSDGGEERFEIRYVVDGVHSVRVPAATDELCETAPPDTEEGAGETDPDEAGDQVSAQDATTDPVIDMLVAYTPQARRKQGGTDAMIALIQLGIADTNRAFVDSGVNASVRLVGTIEVKQAETSSFSKDLTALKSTSGGRWDEVHSLRKSLGADQVTMIADYPNSSTAGIGTISATRSTAFTVVKRTTFGQYTFSHELGHNIGLRHEDGYQNSSGRFRTIMAYGSYSRIRRFSNPDQTYGGYRTGTSSHNSVAILKKRTSGFSGLMEAVETPVVATKNP